MAKAERKMLAHYIDAACDLTYAATDYVRLGADLEEFSVELNPNVESSENILGQKSVKHNGYDASADASPVYYDYDDSLTEKLFEIANTRAHGDDCKTSYVDVLLQGDSTTDTTPTVLWAYRESCYLIPQSYGGDTSGVQIPFQIQLCGDRVKGSFNLETKKFTASGDSL